MEKKKDKQPTRKHRQLRVPVLPEIYDKYQRQTWADWLRTKATGVDQEALGALRTREAAQGTQG